MRGTAWSLIETKALAKLHFEKGDWHECRRHSQGEVAVLSLRILATWPGLESALST
jgi:hypothetical protein